MDRRRIILAIIAVLGVIAVGDVYVNGLHVLKGRSKVSRTALKGLHPLRQSTKRRRTRLRESVVWR